jgi:uncharacterized alpha-E superfamily protein
MLSRTADHLFWLARYMERVENLARIVQVGHRMASLAGSLGAPSNEWSSTLVAAGCEPGFLAKHAAATAATVIDYLVRDPANPSSMLSCLETARRNGRAVRTALTVDMWSALNDTWLKARSIGPEAFDPERVGDFLDWIKERSQLFTGAYETTMLRNDAYHFTRLGTFVERADNTARILDVKYHVLLPQHEGVGGALDYYQWQAILSSVSALRSYHWVYHERLNPRLVAEFMILREEMPRSLLACFEQITGLLDRIAAAYGGERGECHRLADEIHARLRGGQISQIMSDGLHEFLTDFIERSSVLGNSIASQYLV